MPRADDGNLTYELFTYTVANDEVTVTGFNTGFTDYVEVPEKIYDKPVTAIGENAFNNCQLTGITLPEGLKTIGNFAFQWCDNLTEITIPKSVTSIGKDAFSGCNMLETVKISDIDAWCKIAFGSESACPLTYADKLLLNGESVTEVTVPSGVTVISPRLLSFKSLEKVTIPKSVVFIGNHAFYNCEALTNVTLSEGLKTIDCYAFCGCTALTELTVPKSLTTVYDGAFESCEALESIKISDIDAWCKISFAGDTANPLYYADKLLLNGNPVTDVTVPEGITALSPYLFSCKSLKTVTIPKSITTVNEGAFECCEALETVKISDIDAWCKISFAGDTANPLYYADKLLLNGTEVTEVTVPEGVTELGPCQLSCRSLTKVTIPAGVKSIGGRVFCGCVKLTSVTLPAGLESIGESAFYDCRLLTAITFPESLEEIGDSAFNGCIALKAISLPKNIKTIPDSAFYCCYSLENVTFADGLEIIGDYAFEYCYYLDTLTVPDSVTEIGHSAFFDCEGLKKITLSKSLKKIGTDAFTYTAYYNNVSNWSENALYIGEYLLSFSPSDKFTAETFKGSYTVKAGTKLIADAAFSYCVGLTEIVLPKSLTHIGMYAFSDCTGLTTVNYLSTEKDWKGVEITEEYDGNSALINATLLTFCTCGSNEFGEWKTLTEPTCQSTGLKERICKKCNERQIKSIAKIFHTVEDGACTQCKIKVGIMESAHDHTDDSFEALTEQILTFENALYLNVSFTAETETWPGIDYIYIYDQNSDEIGSYSGTDLSSKTVTVKGDTVKITLSFDESSTYYGYKAYVVPIYAGDVDMSGVINALDLAALRKALITDTVFYYEDCLQMDVTGDEEIDLLDLIRLKKYLANPTEVTFGTSALGYIV